jgi:hypothetical protein
MSQQKLSLYGKPLSSPFLNILYKPNSGFRSRAALEQQLVDYATEYFPLGAVGVYGSKQDDGKIVCTVCLSAARFQGANYKYAH